jgi:hypothetical protein
MFTAACLSLRSLGGLAVPFSFEFLPGYVDQASDVLAVVIVLVSLDDGAPDLVELGRVAYVVFAGFLKNPAVFSCLSFLINRTHVRPVCISFRPVFLINWLFLFFLIKRQRYCWLLQKNTPTNE